MDVISSTILTLSLLLAISIGFNVWFSIKYKPWTALGRVLNAKIDEWQGQA